MENGMGNEMDNEMGGWKDQWKRTMNIKKWQVGKETY